MELDSLVVEHDRSRSLVCVCVCVRACGVCTRMYACGFSWIRAHRVEKCVRDNTGDDFYDQCRKIYIHSLWMDRFEDFG